jgi:hypothetical protein
MNWKYIDRQRGLQIIVIAVAFQIAASLALALAFRPLCSLPEKAPQFIQLLEKQNVKFTSTK